MVTNYIIVMIWVKTPSTKSLKGLDMAFNYIYTYIFEKSQGKHNNLNSQYFLGIDSITCKFQCSKFDANQKSFCVFQTFKPLKSTIIFFNCLFFLMKCAPFFLKIGKDFNMDD